MKLKELKEFLNKLTDEQLEQTATILGEMDTGFSGGDLSISILDEDQWYSGDGFFPKSSITEEEFQEYQEYYGSDAKVAIPAGRIVFDLNEGE